MRRFCLLIIFVFCPLSAGAQQVPFRVGEVITYDIRQIGLKVGQATLTLIGETPHEGRNLFLVVLKADGFNFYDQEEVYLDPVTFYPVLVLRDLNIFGKKEKIREDYLQDAKKIYIHKTSGGKTTEQVLDTRGAVDNIYGFIYRYRKSGSFTIGEEVDIHLPTQDLKIGIVKKIAIDVARRRAASAYMESRPDKYKIWFGIDRGHIPFKISGAVGIGNTLMVMTDYKG